MTYAQLLNALYEMPKDRLEDTVTVYDPDRDDFCSVNHTETATEKDNDVLDPGHFFLTLKSYGI
jgi:hypothetical protein